MNRSNLRPQDSKAANRVIVRKRRNVRNRAEASRAEASRAEASRAEANRVVANKVAVSKADDKPCIVN